MKIHSLLFSSAAISILAAQSPRRPEKPRVETYPSYTSAELPPPRIKFEANAPDEVLLGRLWTDIIWFHPFGLGQTRDAWEKDYFGLLNRAASKEESLQNLAAAALGKLNDPASMLMPSEEGHGESMLPLIWELRGNEIWLVGGSKALVPSALGPLQFINGIPVQTWLKGRVGESPSPSQAIAALNVFGQREAVFKSSFTLGGSTLTIESSQNVPTDLWIDGGWKGMSIHDLPESIPSESIALDLRTAHLLRGDSLRRVIARLSTWRRAAKTKTTYRVAWSHIGLGNDFSNYQSHLSAEPVAPLQPVGAKLEASAWLGASNQLPSSLAEILAGWVLDPNQSVAASVARYTLGPWTVQLRTATYGAPLSYALGTGPNRHFLVPGWGATQTLSVPAARALAAATVINFDHHFAFTPAEFQASAFKGLIKSYQETNSVIEFLNQVGASTKDPHPTFLGLSTGARSDQELKVRDASTPGIPFIHPFVLTVDPNPPRILLFTGLNGLQEDMRVGSHILSVEGVPAAEWLKRSAAMTPFRDGEWMRWARPLHYLWQKEVLNVELELPSGKHTQIQYRPIPNQAFKFALGTTIQQPPKGWTLVRGAEKSYEEIDRFLESGTNVVLDMRFGPPSGNLGRIHGGPVPVTSHERMPINPITWGTRDDGYIRVRQLLFGEGTKRSSTDGQLIVLVWGLNQSSLETSPWTLRLAYPNSKLVGLPTAGITTQVVELQLPLGGGSSSHASFYPTGGWSTFSGKSFHYRGLTLDSEISLKTIKEWIRRGSQDPLLDAVIKNIKPQ
jgi:hypothetical protein